ARGEGALLVKTLFEKAEERGIDIRYETAVDGLLQDADGRICGVSVRTRSGKQQLEADAVVLASGGFQANPAMRTAYLGPVWSNVKVRGTRFNTGDLIQPALAVGAVAYGDWSGCHATPIDADASDYGE